MTAQFARASYQSRPGGPTLSNPQAALLIDFANVTMGIRSDLSKELKNLLGSDIIKGKVAVQRAYADWRRYPQYIVPLAESSVDLIFAPAYGSSKKNATDIRLAIDALELVFTRPEIGVFILLSGDSDFSSLVLKLKEYGKYVVGVGIRESASDLLVQNCDEYYSYSALTGLTKTTDDMGAVSNDPWELVEIAVRQMTDAGDVMRSDRLKQVLVELDPNFDEKTIGFTKFNRFVQEAANRGLVKLHKMENGQFEVALSDAAPAGDVQPRTEEERADGRRGRRRGRGRRDDRGRREGGVAPEPSEAAAPELEVATQVTEPSQVAMAKQPAAAPRDLDGAYALLRRAVREIAKGGIARDSDVKRRILEISPDFDEAFFGFSKFSRFLRQAHEAQVVDVRKLENGSYEVTLGDGSAQPDRGRPPEDRPRRGRERPEPAPETTTAAARSPEPVAVPDRAPMHVESAPARPQQPAVTVAAAAVKAEPVRREETPPPAPVRSLTLRRGSRGRPSTAGPPPLLEGQAVAPSVRPASREPAEVDTPATGKLKSEPKERAARETRAKGKARPRETGKGAAPVRKRAFDAAALGLPSSGVEVTSYLANQYKGVGEKMAESLIEVFGAANVFEGLQTQPERVKSILGAKRGEKLLEAWQDDYAFRVANATDPKAKKNEASSAGARAARPRGGRGRRSGKGRNTGATKG